jgi:hypothetical protein
MLSPHSPRVAPRPHSPQAAPPKPSPIHGKQNPRPIAPLNKTRENAENDHREAVSSFHLLRILIICREYESRSAGVSE